MTIGTLRDQIIYPDSIGNMKMKGFTDNHLKDFLDKVSIFNSPQKKLQARNSDKNVSSKFKILMDKLDIFRPVFLISYSSILLITESSVGLGKQLVLLLLEHSKNHFWLTIGISST